MRAEEQAAFCLLTGQAPEVFLALTKTERDAFVRLASNRK